MEAPRFSVVMPVHDSATTVAESIASVRGQSFTDWELLVIDDASTDGSIDVAPRSACAGMAQPLTVASTAPGTAGRGPAGPARARNVGLAEARGSLLAFLDADDTWDPEYLATRARTFAEHPDIGLVWGPSVIWHPEQPERPDHVEGTEIAASVRRFEPGDVLPIWLHSVMRTPTTGATVVRTDVARAVGGFPVGLRRGEDVAMWMGVGAAAPTMWDDRVLFRCRRHSGSSTSRASSVRRRDADDLAFHQWVARFVYERRRLDCRAAAARNLHGGAELAAAHRPAPSSQWMTTRTFLSEPGARPYWWWLATDWLLPRRLARRAAAVLHEWSGADAVRDELIPDRHRRMG